MGKRTNKMTSSNALKCVVSDYETTTNDIQEQEGKEIFEYSVFGSLQQKIGDFTQTKIGVFS